MILRKCAVLKLHAVNPKFVNIGDIKIGEKDHFHTIAREKGKWYFYRRIEQQMTEIEKESLQNFSKKVGMTYDVTVLSNIIRMEIPEIQGNFYDGINNITGCRVSPITLQSGGDVYLSIEFTENLSDKVSDKILEFINEDSPYRKSIIYMGTQQDKVPYLLNFYLSLGNSPHDLSMIKSRWAFKEKEAIIENEGVFQNRGEFIPKKIVDDETDELIWRMDSREPLGGSKIDSVDEGDHIFEMKVRSHFFSDFYYNVVRTYCGAVFSGYYCDKGGLTSYYIIEKVAQQRFLQGLQKHWSLEKRRHHLNYLLEIGDLGSYNEIPHFPY
ncbi:MAG: hypothetical protein ACYCSG_01690 [Thermoplasmataceae archaeon]